MTATTAPRLRRVGTAHRPLAAAAAAGGRCPPYGSERIPAPPSSHHAPLDLIPIPQETIVRAVARLDAIFSDPNASHRDTNAAARTLLAFLKHNHDILRALMAAQDDEATPPPSEDNESLDPADTPDAEDTSGPLSTLEGPSAPSPSASPAAAPALAVQASLLPNPTQAGRPHYKEAPADSGASGPSHRPPSPPSSRACSAPASVPVPPIPYVNLDLPRDGKPAVMLVAEDPAPDAPAFERYGGLVLFRVGARTNLQGDIRSMYYRLPPGPERELLRDPSVPLHRRGGGFARLQRFAELGLPPYVVPADARTRPP